MMSETGNRVRRGRPLRGEARKIIYLHASVFDLWNVTKIKFGMENDSNSKFASFLLEKVQEFQQM